MNHFIEKMIIDLQIKHRSQAHHLQNKVSRLFNQKLQKITDEVLSKYSTPETVIVIPKLEIDLKNLRSTHLELDFVNRYRKALEKAVEKQVRHKKYTTATPKNSSEVMLNQSQTESELNILIFFLEHGRLPSNAPQNINLNDLLIKVFQKQQGLAILKIKPLLKKKYIIHRLVYSFSETTTTNILEQFAPKVFAPIQTAIQNVFAIFNVNNFSIRQQKLHKQLLLVAMELMQQSFVKNGRFELRLEDLHKAYLRILPKEWQNVDIPIYDTNFSIEQSPELNIKELIELPYKDLKKVLKQSENRYFLITKGSQNNLETILKNTAGQHFKAIQQIIEEVLNEDKYQIANTKTAYNMVWANVLEYLAARKSPTSINLKVIKKIIVEQFKNKQHNELIVNLQESEKQELFLEKTPEKEDKTTKDKSVDEKQKAKSEQQQQEQKDELIAKSTDEKSTEEKSVDEKQKAKSEQQQQEQKDELIAKSTDEKSTEEESVDEKQKAKSEQQQQEQKDELIIKSTDEKSTEEKSVDEKQKAKSEQQQQEQKGELIIKSTDEKSTEEKSVDEKSEQQQQKQKDELIVKSTDEKSVDEKQQREQKDELIIKSADEKTVDESQKTIEDKVEKDSEIKKKFLETKTFPKPEVIPLNYRVEDILEIYLLHGYFIQSVPNHDVLITNMLSSQPRKLRVLLTRVVKTKVVIERLINNLTPATLEAVAELLVPNNSFIRKIKPELNEENQAVLYKLAIRQQLKYGKAEVALLLNELLEILEDKVDLETFIKAILSNNLDEKHQIIIRDYLALDTIVNPEEEETEKITEATRYLDFFIQSFENPTNNWWTKTISKTDFNEHFQTMAGYYPEEIEGIINKVRSKKSTLNVLLELLEERNLTLLMNILEPSLFGFISTIILTCQDFVDNSKSWEIALKAYFSLSKPLNTNAFSQQAMLLLAKELNKSYSEILVELTAYSDKKIEQKQHRYHALKQIIRQELRFNRQPTILDNLETEAASNDTINEVFEAIEIPTSLNIEVIGYYLKYGTLPQAYRNFTQTDIIRTIKLQGFENLNLLKIAIQKIIENPTSTKRLEQLPEPILRQLIQTLQPKIGLSILPYLEDLRQVIDYQILILPLLRVVNEVTILTHKSGYIQHYIYSILEMLSKTLSYTPEKALPEIIERFDTLTPKTNIVKQLRRILARINKQEEELTIDDKPTPVVERAVTPLKDTTIYINNAGVVLLNPFIPYLLKMLGLTEKKDFKDLESSCRAAYLIHYIATGNPTPLEHELILPKIMCSIPLEQPINSIITLTEEEMDACNQLIKAGINRWKKMSNSSVEGFRNSFLRREGKLLKISKGWSLSVEQKTFDIMLKTLPWGISMVRFGWMEQPIYVEWAY